MIQNLINCLTAYKSKMEYQAIDFDGDRAAQHKELRKEMAKLYEIEDETLFGRVSLSAPTGPIEDRSKEDKKKFLAKQKEENSQIQKGHQRIQEKVKEIRQNFSKAVTTGKRSGSGKLIYEFYDELVYIFGENIRQQNPLPMALIQKVLLMSNLHLQLQPRRVLIAS